MADLSAFGQLLLLSAIMFIVVYAADLLVILGIVKLPPTYEYAISVAAGIILGTAVCVLDPLGSDYLDNFLVRGGERGLAFALSGFFTGFGIIYIMILNRIKTKDQISPVLFLHSCFDGFCLGYPCAQDNFSNSAIVLTILALHRIIMTLALSSNLLKNHTRNEVLIGMFGFGVAAFVGSLISFGIVEGFNGKEKFAASSYGCFLTAGSFISAVFDDIFPDLKKGTYGLNPVQISLASIFLLACALLPLNYSD